MRPDLQPGSQFPDFSLDDTEGKPVQLGRYMDGWPTIVTFNRGNYCPKDHRQLTRHLERGEADRAITLLKEHLDKAQAVLAERFPRPLHSKG